MTGALPEGGEPPTHVFLGLTYGILAVVYGISVGISVSGGAGRGGRGIPAMQGPGSRQEGWGSGSIQTPDCAQGRLRQRGLREGTAGTPKPTR